MFGGFPFPFPPHGGIPMMHPQQTRATPGNAHYETLGVPRTATAGEIKKAYHKLARETHANSLVGSNDEEAFKKISAAYQVLSDSEKRAAYDRAGDEGVKELEHMPAFAKSAAASKPPAIRASLRVGYADIMNGKEVSITYQRIFSGTQETTTATVYVPRGHVDQVPIVLSEQGHERRGDVTVNIATPDSEGPFSKRGFDLTYNLAIPLWRALIGGNIELPKLPGDSATVHITLPTDRPLKSGDEFEVPRRGFPMFGMPDVRGSLIVILQVNTELPSHVSRDALLSAASSLGAPAFALVPSSFSHAENELISVNKAAMQKRNEDLQSAVRAYMEEHASQSHGGVNMPPGVHFNVGGGSPHVQQVQCAQQ